jgi:hypothetical protein
VSWMGQEGCGKTNVYHLKLLILIYREISIFNKRDQPDDMFDRVV